MDLKDDDLQKFTTKGTAVFRLDYDGFNTRVPGNSSEVLRTSDFTLYRLAPGNNPHEVSAI